MPIRRKLPQVRGNRSRPRGWGGGGNRVAAASGGGRRAHPISRRFPIRPGNSACEYLGRLPLVGRKRGCRGVVSEGVEDVGRVRDHDAFPGRLNIDRKSTRLNSSHLGI